MLFSWLLTDIIGAAVLQNHRAAAVALAEQLSNTAKHKLVKYLTGVDSVIDIAGANLSGSDLNCEQKTVLQCLASSGFRG